MASTPTIPTSGSGLEYRFNVPFPVGAQGFPTAIPGTPTQTTAIVIGRLDRKVRFRELGVFAQQSVVSGAPATNHIRLEFWQYADGFASGTKIAQATITGVTSGTQLERGTSITVATLAGMLQSNAEATAKSIIEARFVVAATLSRGLSGSLFGTGDYID